MFWKAQRGQLKGRVLGKGPKPWVWDQGVVVVLMFISLVVGESAGLGQGSEWEAEGAGDPVIRGQVGAVRDLETAEA